jgi:hypothetical protein
MRALASTKFDHVAKVSVPAHYDTSPSSLRFYLIPNVQGAAIEIIGTNDLQELDSHHRIIDATSITTRLREQSTLGVACRMYRWTRKGVGILVRYWQLAEGAEERCYLKQGKDLSSVWIPT